MLKSFKGTTSREQAKQTVDKWEENWEDFEDSGEKDTPSKPLENQTASEPSSSLSLQTQTIVTTTTTITHNNKTSTPTKEVKEEEAEDFFKDLQVNYKPAKKIEAPVAPSKRLLLDEPKSDENSNNNNNWEDDLNI